MKVLCLTIYFLILRVRSIEDILKESNYPNYFVNPLTINTEQIYFEDQLARNPENSDLFVRQVTPEYGDVQNGDLTTKTVPEFQPNTQQLSTSVNPANFHLWNKDPVNTDQNTVNRNAGLIKKQVSLNQYQDTINQGKFVTNQDQVPTNQNQIAANQNQAFINSNQGTPVFNQASSNANLNSFKQSSFKNKNKNIRVENIDLSALDDTFNTNADSQMNSETQVPSAQKIQGLFGESPDIGTLNSVKPTIDKIGPSVTHFGLNLMKIFGNLYDGNTVISPFSISTCLALLQQGTHGATQSQITNALQLRPEETKSVYKSLANDIKKRNSHNILITANNIYMAKSFEFLANFSNIAQDDFDSNISTLDFNQTIAAREINKWVAGKTHNKITELVRPSDVGPATQMVLVNAVYFKGLWGISFNEAKTKRREFHLINGQKKIVPFMRSRRTLKGGIEPVTKTKVMSVPFENDEYSLMWVLPPPDSNINDYIKTLTAEDLLEFKNFPEQECDFEVPKFTIRTDANLIPPLRSMGLSEMFGPYADFSGLGGNRIYNAHLQVSSAVHSAVLTVDEQGGSAAAATSFGVVALSYDSPVKFKADRPFLVVLWDHASDVPLFMAKIMEPIEV